MSEIGKAADRLETILQEKDDRIEQLEHDNERLELTQTQLIKNCDGWAERAANAERQIAEVQTLTFADVLASARKMIRSMLIDWLEHEALTAPAQAQPDTKREAERPIPDWFRKIYRLELHTQRAWLNGYWMAKRQESEHTNTPD